MLTAGKQVIVWLSDEGVRLFLGLERPSEEKSRWAFIGKVGDGALTQLGLWLIIERVEEREMGTAVWSAPRARPAARPARRVRPGGRRRRRRPPRHR